MTMQADQTERPEQPRPTLFDVALVDVRVYQFFNIGLVCVCAGGLFLFGTTHTLAAFGCLLGAAVFGGLLAWRLQRFRVILREGEAVAGTLEAIQRPVLATGRGRFRHRFRYGYIYNEQPYQYSAFVSVVVQGLTLEPGDRITVLVRPTHPDQSLVPAFYMKTIAHA